MKPAQVLLFLLAVLLLLAVTGALIPSVGIPLGRVVTLHFPSPQEVLFPTPSLKVDISDILALPTDSSTVNTPVSTSNDTVPDRIDITQNLDTSALPPLEMRIALHYPEGDRSILHPFFSSLEGAKGGKRPIRIMHYGDSQLEGDRITSYVRNKLQSHFGGHGPGLVSIVDIVPNFSVDRILEGDWKRYSVMGRRDSTQRHQRFGALSSFSRFSPILPDSVSPDPQSVRTARVVLRPNKRSYGRAREWNVCRVYFGWHRAPVTIGLEREGTLVSEEEFQPGATLMTREWRFPSPPTEVTLSFSGADSPDIYAISLEGGPGVCMDNIAARGGAGYEFRTMDQQLLGSMYDQLDVKLLILQYGGNVLPHMKSAEEAAQYGRAFGAQLRRFKQLIRGVKVIVIGPSDMSIKEGEQYVTRPFLEEVRDALKANTLAEGGAFWDLYEAMGGRGSMASWVDAVPPLAATDYTHFTPLGAKKVGELFYSALINDHAAYLATKPVTMKEAVKKPMSKTPSNDSVRP